MRKSKIIILLILTIFLLPGNVYAAEPYRGYNYDSFGTSIPAPNGYEPDKTITGVSLGIGNFDKPEDMFVDRSNQMVYILDSGNKRIVVLNKDLTVSRIIDKYYDNGKACAFGMLTGIFVLPAKGIYLADKEGSCILFIDFNGNLIKTYEKPKSSLYKNTNFLPSKVLVDSAQNVYALCNGVYQGAVLFDNMGKFIGYYGSTKVVPTPQIIIDSLWKKIMSQDQKSTMERYVPTEYTGFDIDKNDFVYTVTQTSTDLTNLTLRKLNPKGDNILKSEKAFGDLDIYYSKGKPVVTQFIDVHVDDDGFIYALDLTGSKVFQYDSEGNLMFIFGRNGSQTGTLKQPAAVDTIGKTVLVLDKRKNSISTFVLTEFGEYVHKAIVLYNKGLYAQAREPWLEVIKRDSNFELAYVGLGKAALNTYQYEEAMRYFKLGKDRVYYSKAFRQYRMNYVRGHFPIIITCLLILLLAVMIIRRRNKIWSFISNRKSGRYIAR